LNFLAERSFIFPAGFLERVAPQPKQGREYEYKNFSRGLLSTDTLGTTARSEAAGSFAKIMACNHGQEILKQSAASGPLELRYQWRRPPLLRAFGWPAVDR
jgi:hypothetical protein